MEDATRDLVIGAMRAVGIHATAATNDCDGELVIDVGGTRRRIHANTVATVTPTTLHRELDRSSSTEENRVSLVVADRVVGAARDLLRSRGQSWLDLRGHLYLTGPGLLVDAPVPPVATPSVPSRGPLKGNVALAVACELLMFPDRRHAIRELARTLHHSPSSVSVTMSDLRNAGLVTTHGQSVVPQLFWETAAVWKPVSIPVATLSVLEDPAVARILKTNVHDVDCSGWALTDSLAAAAYGAPIGISVDHPPDLYVPDTATARRAQTLLGASGSATTRAANVKIAPVPQVCASRKLERSRSWPLAHPLFVALDLAQDLGRGVEILGTWYPRAGIDHVW